VDRLLARGLTCLSVLDVSGAALARATRRLGAEAGVVCWIEADVTSNWQSTAVDIWHDRAVFHFLIDADDRACYLERARRLIRPGGHLVMATFAADGPSQCSGLPVRRYDVAGLADELGPSFPLVRSITHSHTTPAGRSQPFTYALFRFDGPQPGTGSDKRP
jgi:SAM-dependent methyltransferase